MAAVTSYAVNALLVLLYLGHVSFVSAKCFSCYSVQYTVFRS